MAVTLATINLGSTLDQLPGNWHANPGLYNRSPYIDLITILNQCVMADQSTLLKNADGNWGKAYRYWTTAPSTWEEIGNLYLEVPQEITTIGRYLITYERLRIEELHPTPAWVNNNRQCNCNPGYLIFFVGCVIATISITLLVLQFKNKL